MKRGDFNIKSGYFEGLEGEIMSKIALKNKQDFQVPENYFRDLDFKIEKKVKQKNSKIITLRLPKLAGIAASIVIGMVLFWPNSVNSENLDLNTSIAYLNEEDFDSYSEEIYRNIDLSGESFEDNLDIINEEEIYLTEELIEEIYHE